MSKSKKSALKTISGSIPCSKSELDLGITLKGGQSFRWKSTLDNKYRGVISSSIWTLHQDSSNLLYEVRTSTLTPAACAKVLKNYFRLDLSLKSHLEKWSASDENFSKFSSRAQGVRILDQNVIENLFSFICSANNHISRITTMIERMCVNFGEEIGQIEEEMFWDFPKIETLSQESVTAVLLEAGFGYRAKYIRNAAAKLVELGGEEWLEGLHRNSGISYEEARQKLRILPGIGPKVADCICLMSLGHLEAIPVDTHIYQVAKETYLPDLKKFSTGSGVYEEINKHFREIWGPFAGWAQAVVFCMRINDKGSKGDTTGKKKAKR